MQDAAHRQQGATVFAYPIHDPERYGVVEMDANGRALSAHAHSKALGAKRARDYRPQSLRPGTWRSSIFTPNSWVVEWLDTGAHDSLLEAAAFIQVIEKRQGLKIACPEENRLPAGYIDAAQLERIAAGLDNSGYSAYLRGVQELPRTQ